MTGHRAIPEAYPDYYNQICHAFKRKLQCQIWTLQSPSSSPDRKSIEERLEELEEEIAQIGYLAQTGELLPRDSSAVVRAFGARSVLEISRFIRQDLEWIRGLLRYGEVDVLVGHLERVMKTLPF